jgi:hypothetical protein
LDFGVTLEIGAWVVLLAESKKTYSEQPYAEAQATPQNSLRQQVGIVNRFELLPLSWEKEGAAAAATVVCEREGAAAAAAAAVLRERGSCCRCCVRERELLPLPLPLPTLWERGILPLPIVRVRDSTAATAAERVRREERERELLPLPLPTLWERGILPLLIVRERDHCHCVFAAADIQNNNIDFDR